MSCDCEQSRKERALKSHVGNEIEYVVITENCGGAGALSDILDAILTTWNLSTTMMASGNTW